MTAAAIPTNLHIRGNQVSRKWLAARIAAQAPAPLNPGEYAAYLQTEGAFDELDILQTEQRAEGRAAALRGEPFNIARTSAWQTGYAEVVAQMEPMPYDLTWSDNPQHWTGTGGEVA